MDDGHEGTGAAANMEQYFGHGSLIGSEYESVIGILPIFIKSCDFAFHIKTPLQICQSGVFLRCRSRD
jgi:hypothetical protein